ncbi:MAG: hypothetical protein HGA45_07710 [Chloroflexales bacterium]|nr:hypothetical protein [Chloroflexales bacterium]
MARSLRSGDFDLVLAIQSPSSPDRWYRVLLDRARALTGETVLSCDCVGWRQDERNAAARRAIAAGSATRACVCPAAASTPTPPRHCLARPLAR